MMTTKTALKETLLSLCKQNPDIRINYTLSSPGFQAKALGFSSIISSFIDERKAVFPLGKDIESIHKELKRRV